MPPALADLYVASVRRAAALRLCAKVMNDLPRGAGKLADCGAEALSWAGATGDGVRIQMYGQMHGAVEVWCAGARPVTCG